MWKIREKGYDLPLIYPVIPGYHTEIPHKIIPSGPHSGDRREGEMTLKL